MDRYAFLMLAMSMEEAKAILGFPPNASPSDAEVQKAWRTKAFEMHPDRGGDPAQMVEVNVAKDVLTGKQRPTYGRPSPASPTYEEAPVQTRWEKPKAEEVSFDEAKNKAGIPTGVEWQFVTDVQKGTGYTSDEYHRSDTCWVAYGKTAQKHVFVAARHFVYNQYFVGSKADQDKWEIRSLELPIKGDEGTQPAWLYGNIVKALRLVDFDGKFNSKVVDARGWAKFDDKLPRGTGVSLKHWLADSGLVSGDDPSVAGRKHVVEVTYSRSFKPLPDHYQVDRGGYGSDYEAVGIVCNGKPEYLNERDLARFVKGGLVRSIFGDYVYGGERKNLTRMRNGKKVMELLVDEFDLSAATKAILTAAAAQMK